MTRDGPEVVTGEIPAQYDGPDGEEVVAVVGLTAAMWMALPARDILKPSPAGTFDIQRVG